MADPIQLDLDAWRARLAAPGLTLEQRADLALGLYKEAAAKIKAITSFQQEVKALLGDVLAERGGDLRFKSATGECYVSGPSLTVRYDSKALDALCASSPNLAAALAPHRKESSRDGSLVIR